MDGTTRPLTPESAGEEHFVDIPTAARMLGVSRNTGFVLARSGELVTVSVAGRRVVKIADVVITKERRARKSRERAERRIAR